jgi:hypothetical protein
MPGCRSPLDFFSITLFQPEIRRFWRSYMKKFSVLFTAALLAGTAFACIGQGWR